MFSSKVLKISNTLRCLAECWLEAEESLRRDINNLYPLADEEFITKMFHGKYKEILREVSEQGLIKDRFLSDLRVAFPGLGNELYRIADGLIAEVSLHRRTTERITGGDLGFVIIRPNVVREYDYLKIKDHRTGLLCQAKLKNRKGKWGQLSANQIKVLQDRLPYFALLLYSYNDQERRYLNPFKWKICNTAKDVKEVQNWLKKDEFSGLLSSDEVYISTWFWLYWNKQ